jgi:hypothetical protein
LKGKNKNIYISLKICKKGHKYGKKANTKIQKKEKKNEGKGGKIEKKTKNKNKKTHLKSSEALLCFCSKSCCSKLAFMLHCDLA